MNRQEKIWLQIKCKEQDNRCALCKKLMFSHHSSNEYYPENLKPHIGYRIPLAYGGLNVLENVEAMHLKCANERVFATGPLKSASKNSTPLKSSSKNSTPLKSSSKKSTRKNSTSKNRKWLLKRFEEQSGFCALCFTPMVLRGVECKITSMSATVDHIIPLSKGGPNNFANVQAVHNKCNNRKGNDLEMRPWIKKD